MQSIRKKKKKYMKRYSTSDVRTYISSLSSELLSNITYEME